MYVCMYVYIWKCFEFILKTSFITMLAFSISEYLYAMKSS